MHALQDLGEALMALDPSRLAELDLPERLVDALRDARSTRSHEGARRQRQYVGKLMREVDAEPLRAALERISQGKQSDQAEVTAAEKWRESLLRDDDAMARLVIEFPDADRVAIAKLVRDARQELARNGPPHRYRELFRQLKALAVKRAAAAAAASDRGARPRNCREPRHHAAHRARLDLRSRIGRRVRGQGTAGICTNGSPRR